jgi:hypothetical protein
MTSDEATLAVIDAVEALRIPYMVVGSLSSNFYGVSRSTRDADFVLQFSDVSAGAIAERLGPAFRLDPQLSFETVTMTTRQVLDLVGVPFKIELFHLSDDPHDQERFQRRRRQEMQRRQIFLPTAEDVIIAKLRWYVRIRRHKDWDDARDVIAVQGDALDWEYIHAWCEKHGTRQVLDEIRQSIPPI